MFNPDGTAEISAGERAEIKKLKRSQRNRVQKYLDRQKTSIGDRTGISYTGER